MAKGKSSFAGMTDGLFNQEAAVHSEEQETVTPPTAKGNATRKEQKTTTTKAIKKDTQRPETEKNVQRGYYIPESLAISVKLAAVKRGMPTSDLVRDAIIYYLEKEPWKN